MVFHLKSPSRRWFGLRDEDGNWPLINPKLVVLLFLVVSSAVGGYFIFKRIRDSNRNRNSDNGNKTDQPSPPPGSDQPSSPGDAPAPGTGDGDKDENKSEEGSNVLAIVLGSVLAGVLLFGTLGFLYFHFSKSAEAAQHLRTAEAKAENWTRQFGPIGGYPEYQGPRPAESPTEEETPSATL